MDKLKMHSPDLVAGNIERLADLFPGCVTESQGEDGRLKRSIDFDLLRQELSDHVVEGPQERYRLDWPGKREALLAANAPIAKTLRPCREESVDFDSTQNLFIEGDNLDALKLLQETYLGAVKLIYIDPPYNTGSDFVYADDFKKTALEYRGTSNEDDDTGRLVANTEANGRFHSDWLSMIYPRMKLARTLLAEDGVVMISIDDNEFSSLGKVMEEIFGQDNFLSILIWNKQHSQQQGVFKRYHEYVVCYAKDAKNIESISGGQGEIEAGALKKISRSNPASEFTFPAGVRFEAVDSTELTGTYGDSEQVTVVSGRLIAESRKTKEPVTLRAGWTQRNQMESWFNGRDTYDSKGQRVLEFYFNGAGKLKCRKDRSKITLPSILPEYGMVSASTAYVTELMGSSVFQNPKPVAMIQDFIRWFVKPRDLVMDFFAGSGTTGEACFRVQLTGTPCRSILVQLPEELDPSSAEQAAGAKLCSQLGKPRNIAELTKERLRRSGGKLAEVAEGSHDIDFGFRVLKIDSSNMAEVYYRPDELEQDDLLTQIDNIRPGRTAEDLLFQVLLDWGVDLSLPITREDIDGREVFFVDGNALAACFVADGSVDEALVKQIAQRQPLRVVFRDAGFASDNARINVEQIFKALSPSTEVRTL